MDSLIESEWHMQIKEITHNCTRLNREARRLKADKELDDEGSPPGARIKGSRPAWAQEAIDQVVKPAGHFFVSMCDVRGGWSTLAVLTVLISL